MPSWLALSPLTAGLHHVTQCSHTISHDAVHPEVQQHIHVLWIIDGPDVHLESGGMCAIEYDGYGENISIADGAAIAVHGTVKNLRIAENAAYYFDMGTAVFQGDLDCSISTAELETVNEILVFSDLDSLTLRVKAADFKLEEYNTFSTEYNGSIDYNFILILDDGSAVAMNEGSEYLYNGESFTVDYDQGSGRYS